MNSNCFCSSCNANLGETCIQPCPNCGKIGKTYTTNLTEQTNITDETGISIEQGNTGRKAALSIINSSTDREKIENLVINFTKGFTNNFEEFLNEIIKRFNSQAITNRKYYRGVSIDTKSKLTENLIGPSPNSADGRYNKVGEKCLYLIDNIEFIKHECQNSQLLVQEYSVPVGSMNIANLTPNNQSIHNSLSLIFQLAERGSTASGFKHEKVFTNKGETKYLLSQCIAKAFIKHGWEGLYIPGIHGNTENRYQNLVILGGNVDYWRSWTIGNYFEL